MNLDRGLGLADMHVTTCRNPINNLGGTWVLHRHNKTIKTGPRPAALYGFTTYRHMRTSRVSKSRQSLTALGGACCCAPLALQRAAPSLATSPPRTLVRLVGLTTECARARGVGVWHVVTTYAVTTDMCDAAMRLSLWRFEIH